jgi:hypothetical protein
MKKFFFILVIFFAFSKVAFASIPIDTLGSAGEVYCTIPPYSLSVDFTGYKVSNIDVGQGELLTTTTSGNGLCTGSFVASTASGGNFNGYSGAGTYYVTLYTTNYTVQYGFFVFNCPADGVCTRVSGEVSPSTPAESSTVPYNVHFSGVYSNLGTYDHLCITLTTTDSSVAPFCSPILLLSGFDLPYSFYYLLSPNHSYTYKIRLFDSVNNTYGTETDIINFSTSALPSPATITPAWTPEDCDWSSPSTWSGCLRNLAHETFYPSSESLTQFNNLYAEFKNKPPFGYVTAIQMELSSLNDTNTSVFTLESLPILNTNIFDPLRTGMTWLLWVAFAFVFFNRLKDIQL